MCAQSYEELSQNRIRLQSAADLGGVEKEGEQLSSSAVLRHDSQRHGHDLFETAQNSLTFQNLGGEQVKTVIAVLFGATLTAQAGLSRLQAISMIETGNNDSAIGRAGEISRYQLMPPVWRSYSTSRAYRNPEISMKVARQHLEHLESWYRQKTGRNPSDFDLYVLWNAGPAYYASKHFRAGAVHPLVRERAQRFANLRQGGD